MHALTHASRSSLDDALRHLDLSSLQYTVLSVLARNENLSSSRLSRRFYVTPQAMGEIILLLERKGLIERREDPANKKVLLLSLTRFGKSVCAEGDVQVKVSDRSSAPFPAPNWRRCARSFPRQSDPCGPMMVVTRMTFRSARLGD